MLEEKISKRLKVPYVEVTYNGKKYYLCNNGVIFADEEYLDYANLNVEYARREKEDKLYDYAYAKSTGLLRKKRGTAKTETVEETTNNNGERTDSRIIQASETEQKDIETDRKRTENSKDIKKENERKSGSTAVGFIIALLAFTSLISGYISTLQTATYLYDYVDVISAWLMSSSVTAYNVTAFEVAVLFRQNKRYGLTFVFITLWVTVTVFSMATAVSVFYDRFNFNETETAQENKEIDSNKLALELLRTKEKDLREAIEFKKKDIEYRQEKDYATATVRSELVKLQEELQANLTEQQELLSDTPEVVQEVTKKKERLFAFLGRLLHIDSGVFEFIFSTMSAIFINIIAPLSLSAVIELRRKEKNNE